MMKRKMTAIACLLLSASLFPACGYEVEQIERKIAPQNGIVQSVTPVAEQIVETVVEEVAVPAPELTPVKPVMSKDQLLYKCMNTLVYLDQLSGHTEMKYTKNSPNLTVGDFCYDFIAEKYQSEVDLVSLTNPDEVFMTSEYFVDKNEFVEFQDYKDGSAEDVYQLRTDNFTRSSLNLKDEYPEYKEADTAQRTTSVKKENLYATAGQDPTCAHEIAGCFMPQEMSAGLLTSLADWEIVEIAEFEGRDCAFIEGKGGDYGERLGIFTYELVVDTETGIWMQFEGWDDAGTLQSYIYTDNMKFGKDAEQPVLISPEMVSKKIEENNYVKSGKSNLTLEAYLEEKQYLEEQAE